MKNKLTKTYKQFVHYREKKALLKNFFQAFLPEAVYRNTKLEHPEASRKDIFSFLE